ncbi:hypothetical protein [Azospirillum picis]|uniref:Uncharacterized protein n=1 Tax=Azospirillum picis TaxID=488438 RepID=A0ABU0MM88_9PROT|nr:hypothetical protein [Azospirillum picis]MBP2300547.1 hypothetical protein [Azospirillum picis]MDQ0534516.1 hypothetical protein [Azospirillum picis]
MADDTKSTPSATASAPVALSCPLITYKANQRMPHPNLKEIKVAVPVGSTAATVAENQVRSLMATGNEHLAVYSVAAPHTIWIATTGQPDAVYCGGGNADALLKSASCELYHNHPSNRPFSVSDYIGLVDRNPLLSKMYAIGHDGLSWYEFSPTRGATDIGIIADAAWTLTMNYASAMLWLDPNTGDFMPDDDWSARHGIGLGLTAAGLGGYHMAANTPTPSGLQASIIRRIAKAYVETHAQMLNHCQSHGLPVNHQAVSSALASLTNTNVVSTFAIPYGAVQPSDPTTLTLVKDPAFASFTP